VGDLGALDAVRRSYDAVAEVYAARYQDELRHKPMDRALLARVAETATDAGGGPVADVGCGPGHVTRHLADLGLPVVGVDVSPGMLAVARRLHPDLTFLEGSLLALPAADGAWAAAVALYSIIHLPPRDRPLAWRELLRALAPGGRLLVAFHAGSEATHVEEFLGVPVSLDGYLLDPAEIGRELGEAGFTVELSVERPPIPDVEYPSRRAYVLARRS
jgi:SAM-dependent methyltransferase